MMDEQPKDCSNCGLCCMTENLMPWVNRTFGQRGCLPKDLAHELAAIMDGPLAGWDGCPCVWLNRATGQCKHHEFRPQICRDYEVGGFSCLRTRAEERQRCERTKGER